MAKRLLILIAISAMLCFGACAAPPDPAQSSDTVTETPEPMRVGPRAIVSRDAETGTLTVRVFPVRCVSVSHLLIGDTLSVSVDQKERVIQVEGSFLFRKALGGVKKACQRQEKQFDFENAAPLRYKVVLPQSKSPFSRTRKVADFRHQAPPNPNLICEDANTDSPFAIEGSWQTEGSSPPGIELRSSDGTWISIRSAYRPFGGVVPEFADTDTPYTFDMAGLGKVEFKSPTCALITPYRAEGPTMRLLRYE